MVPGDSIDGHMMSVVCVEERTRVGFGADVQFAFFRTYEVYVVFFAMKIERRAAT